MVLSLEIIFLRYMQVQQTWLKPRHPHPDQNWPQHDCKETELWIDESLHFHIEQRSGQTVSGS